MISVSRLLIALQIFSKYSNGEVSFNQDAMLVDDVSTDTMTTADSNALYGLGWTWQGDGWQYQEPPPWRSCDG